MPGVIVLWILLQLLAPQGGELLRLWGRVLWFEGYLSAGTLSVWGFLAVAIILLVVGVICWKK